jgi:hypothetical protein
MFLQSLGRDSIHHVRLQDTPTSGALSHLEHNPEADVMNAALPSFMAAFCFLIASTLVATPLSAYPNNWYVWLSKAFHRVIRIGPKNP